LLAPLLFVLLLAVGFIVGRLKDLLAATMLLGMASLLSALLFTLLDAVDVAFTEAAVGAGISTVLMLGALSLTDQTERQRRRRYGPILLVLVVGAVLAWGMSDLPQFGDPTAVIHRHVAPMYIQSSANEIGIPNIVTVVLASFRGYDTLGETTVVLTAGVSVLLLLGRRRPRGPQVGDDVSRRPMRMVDMPVVRVVSISLLPAILLFALYVQFHGDYGPGGGFQAGVLFAAGFVLYGLVFGLDALRDLVPARAVVVCIALGALLYGGVGVLTMALGGDFLEYGVLDAHDASHGQHLGILVVELGVGLTVTAVMLQIYYAFAGRWRQS